MSLHGRAPWLSPNKAKTRAMQAVRFLHKALARALPSVHAKRLNALMSAVSALLAGRRLTLTAVGRFMPGNGQPRHAIKRADRLLGNTHLHTERPLFYMMMLRALLGSVKHPLVLVDWSPVDAPGCFFLLRAAIPLAGRSFVIYERVHDREGCPKYQGQLLKALALMLPPDCIPIVVADSGFRRPWFKAVEAQGWYYVGRVRNSDLCRIGEQPWQSIKTLYDQASASPKSLGTYEVTRKSPYFTQFYLLKEPALGRKHKRVTGTIAEDKRSRQNANREREPWLLASNLPAEQWTAAKVVAIYKRRMQIEEGFRDVKSEHLGFGLNLHRSRCAKRIEILLLIAALANYLVFLLGLKARLAGYEQRFQSNSIAHKRTLSLWRLGVEYLYRYGQEIEPASLFDIELALRQEVHQQA